MSSNTFAVWDKMTKRQLDIIKKNYPDPLQWGDGYVLNYTYSKLGGTEYGNSKFYAVKILNSVNPEYYIGLFSNKYGFKSYYSKDSDIGKLVYDYELKNGLKGSAKETWSDILEFKQYFLKENTIIDGFNIELVKGPVDHILDFGKIEGLRNKSIQSQINTGEDFHEGDLKWIIRVNGTECILAQDTTWNVDSEPLFYWYIAPFGKGPIGANKTGDNDDALEAAVKYIQHLEVKKGLKGSAKDTWSDILT